MDGLGILALTLTIQVLVTAALIAPSVAAPVLLPAMGLTPSFLGLYLSAAYAGAVLGSGIGGAIVPRLGAVRLSQYGLAGCAFGLVLLCTGVPALGLAGAVLIGASYGPITPASSQILAATTPPHRLALVFSLKQTGVPLGGVLAGMLVPPVVVLRGWQAALALLALGCLACALLAQRWRPRLDGGVRGAAQVGILDGLAGALKLVRASRHLRALTACAVAFSIAQVGLTSYLVTFLTQELSWTLVAAGVALSLSQSFGAAGRIAWGLVSDRWLGISSTLRLLCGAMAACAAVLSVLTAATPAWIVLAVAAAFGGVAIGWNGVYLSGIARHAPAGLAGAATGGSLMFTYLGVVVGPPSLAAVAGLAGDWRWVFGCMALLLAACLPIAARAGGRS